MGTSLTMDGIYLQNFPLPRPKVVSIIRKVYDLTPRRPIKRRVAVSGSSYAVTLPVRILAPPQEASLTPVANDSQTSRLLGPRTSQLSSMALLIAASLAVLAFSVRLSLAVPVHHASAKQQASSAHPQLDETPRSNNDLAGYQVAPTAPRLLRIESLNLVARILPLGVDDSGAVDTPTNIYDTSWYTGSALPGSSGPSASFIDGHVSGYQRPGVFANLSEVKVGNVIQVERGDGTLLSYLVRKVEVIPNDSVDMAVMLRSVDPSRSGLNLMTCAGEFDTSQMAYHKRLAVFSVLIP